MVKLGTGVLTDNRKQPDLTQMEQLVTQVAAQRKAGREIVLVTSGAVGAGMGALGYDRRPGGLAELQACAAVGQSRLMATYENLFARFDLKVAQVLLTHDDLQHHERHLNARNTLVTLLGRGVVPIINENDAVSFTELKFGDNDTLSALVACLLPADLLVVLTTVDGVIENFGQTNPKTISTIEEIDERIARALGRMGPSILLSASTETIAFAMGAFVGMPAVKNFAAYAAGAVLINALLQVTMFVSVLALNQRRVEYGSVAGSRHGRSAVSAPAAQFTSAESSGRALEARPLDCGRAGTPRCAG